MTDEELKQTYRHLRVSLLMSFITLVISVLLLFAVIIIKTYKRINRIEHKEIQMKYWHRDMDSADWDAYYRRPVGVD